MKFSAVLVALAAAEAASATPLKSRTSYAVKDGHFMPRNWKRVAEAPKDHVLNMHIGLKQSQGHTLDSHLYAVSDPRSSRYGQHLTMEQLNELTKPAEDTLSQVQEWLADAGVDMDSISFSPSKDWISVQIPVEKAEQLLDTEYSIFKHRDGHQLVRTPQWSLPLHLHEHITQIQPTNSFAKASLRAKSLKPVNPFANHHAQAMEASSHAASIATKHAFKNIDPKVAAACNSTGVTPKCLRTLYGTIDYKPQALDANSIGLNDFLGESNNRSDTEIFLSRYRPDAVQGAQDFQFVSINGGTTDQKLNATQLAAGIDLEGNLDIETIVGLDYPMNVTAFTTGGNAPFIPDDVTPTDSNEPYLAWLNYVLNQTYIPQTISTSYDDDEQTVPPSYAKTVCDEFRKLGLRGVSLFFAAGDSGVGQTGDCFSNNGTNATTFLPEFPSTCPYVTAVGATKNFNPEVAAYDPSNDFASGGGFSNYFPRPAYQDDAIPQYIDSLNGTYAGLYNQSGRGLPDIAAQGQTFITIWNGTVQILDGTSAATPTAAGVIALVNDALIAAGKSPLGFLNPWLYQTGRKAFTDVTSGSSIGCGTKGFPAQKGWDAVTGWGTPNFPKILNMFNLTVAGSGSGGYGSGNGNVKKLGASHHVLA